MPERACRCRGQLGCGKAGLDLGAITDPDVADQILATVTPLSRQRPMGRRLHRRRADRHDDRAWRLTPSHRPYLLTPAEHSASICPSVSIPPQESSRIWM